MTDGEIHYIIQNGVQLTGMPAMLGTTFSNRSRELEARLLHSKLFDHRRGRRQGFKGQSKFRSLCRLCIMSEVPRRDL